MSETDLRVLAIRCHTSSCCPAIMVSPDGEDLDQPAFNRKRLKVEKLIDSKALEQLIRVQMDAGCSSDRWKPCERASGKRKRSEKGRRRGSGRGHPQKPASRSLQCNVIW